MEKNWFYTADPLWNKKVIKRFFMKNRHVFMNAIMVLIFVPLYNHSMDKENLWNNALYKSPIDAIFAEDI